MGGASARTVIAADAAVAGGTGPGGGGIIGGGGVGALPRCTKSDQGNCCYDNVKLYGTPNCTWQQIGAGQSVTVTAALKDTMKVALPVALTLTSAAHDKFATYEDCVNKPIGFVLRGPGLKEQTLIGNISHNNIKSDGTWTYQGGGGTQSLVAAQDTSAMSSKMLMPTYTLSEGLCKPLKDASHIAAIAFFDQLEFTVDGVEYVANFRTNPNGGVTGYYVVVLKGF